MFEENTSPIRILIADDDKVIADILRDIISNPERSVEICHDGQTAVDKIKEQFFDLIISDLVMPHKGGMEVLKFAKQLNPEVLVIIVTGYASLETAVDAVKEGAYDYIMKPCKLAEIRIVVDRATEKIKLHKENKDLLKKLQDAYNELMAIDKTKGDAKKKLASLNFFSSSMAGLHYLYSNNTSPNYVEKLQTLSYLKADGTLTEEEFKSFKSYYLKMVNIQN
jgi:DNA-binding NtrC family response regulator